ncbi:MAG TPA: NrfD/PsrC family molybdoenzyme membrane anchor subunit [Bryobacteraceae bacterium]|jgi:formate-dependent nitrite reductase membrane component NrfD
MMVPYSSTDPTYYRKPAIKEPVWIWTVPMYFYVGGVSGAALVFGAVARLLGGPKLHSLVRRCHWIGFVGGGIGSMLLIADLGRPERFLAMLRVLRVRSPMSVGSWILAIAPPCAGAAAVFCDPYSSLAAGILGIPLSGYTAVLISNTAVPLWHEARTSLPTLFMGSAASAAAQVLKLLPGTLSRQATLAVNAFGIAGTFAEVLAGDAVERDVNRLSAVGKPLREGPSGALWKVSKAMTVAGLALSIFGHSRSAQRTGALIGTAGAIALRFAIFHAGKASARDPQATFHLQRLPAAR